MQVKRWGYEIAQMLFDQHKSVDQIVEEFQRVSTKPDPQWVREQVMAVQNNPITYGYYPKKARQ